MIRRLPLERATREEIFVTKKRRSTEKVANNSPRRSGILFDPLGLAPVHVSLTPEPLPSDPPMIRSEIPRSEPPPPRASSMPPSGDGMDVGMPPPLPKIR